MSFQTFLLIFFFLPLYVRIPTWHIGKGSTFQCRRHRKCGFDPCFRKIPCSRKWQPTPGFFPHKKCGFDPWFRKIVWNRKSEPTPVFFPGESCGQRSLVGYSPWGHEELDMTEQMSTPIYKQYFWLIIYWCCLVPSGVLILIFIYPSMPPYPKSLRWRIMTCIYLYLFYSWS